MVVKKPIDYNKVKTVDLHDSLVCSSARDQSEKQLDQLQLTGGIANVQETKHK